MFRKYLKTAYRSLWNNKAYSTINIVGLAMGLTSFILVTFYISYELSFDKFYTNSNSIYRVYMEYKKGGHFEPGDAEAYNQSGPALKKEFSEIKDFVRFFRMNKSILEYNNKTLEVDNGHLVDPSYFNIFGGNLVAGDPSSVLNTPNSIVLSESTSKKIFGLSSPVGESITAYYGSKKTTLTVTGILKDVPENTHMKTNLLVSFQTINTWEVCNPTKLNWNNNDYFTYILVDNKANITELKNKINLLDFPNKEDERHNIEPLTSIHLYSDKPYEAEANGSAQRVRFLFVIAIIIIALSWLNYMNLTLSKSMERLKEIGIRKVSGAKKKQLVFQFMSESVLLNFIALVIASLATILLMPYLNTFTGKNLILGLTWNKALLLLAGIPLIGIIVSGLYPSIILSGFKPAVIMKRKNQNSTQSSLFRQGFVIAQFMATIVLLIGTFTVIKQIKFLDHQPLGANLNKVLSIKSELTDDKQIRENNLKTFKQEVKKMAFVEAVAMAKTYPGEGYDNIDAYQGVTYPDGTKESQTVWYHYEIDEGYISLMDMKMVAGTSFSNQRDTNRYKVIMNEKAARQMGFTNPEGAINQRIKFQGGDQIIIGVLKDYYHFGLKHEIEPFIFTYSSTPPGVLVKFQPEALSVSGLENSIKLLKEKWQQVFPKSTFTYTFIDEKFASLYREERMFGKILMLFTILAIVIASLGLLGLAYYRCMVRTKEIGIRKVNGARTIEVMAMLNRDFIKWIAFAFLLACPIAWYAMHKWLENFAYKTELSWWVFAAAGAIAMFIAFVTVSWQSWRAASRNPVESLRYE